MNASQGERPVAVIGAGVVGMACARALQRAGLAVTVFDPEPPGSQCSAGNAGHIAIDHILPLARPAVLRQVPAMLANPLGPLRLRAAGLPRLFSWLCHFAAATRPAQFRRGTELLAALLARSLADWEEEGRHSGLADLFRRQGAVTVFESERRFAAARRDGALLARHGVAFTDLPPEAVAQHVPGLAIVPAGARYFPDFAHVLDPFAIVTRMADRFAAEGARVETLPVTGFEHDGEAVSAVVTPGGVFPVSAAVIAAGVASRGLAKALHVNAPVTGERGYHVMVGAGAPTLDRPVTFAERGFVLTPMAAGLRAAGTVELGVGPPQAATPPDWRRADILLTHLAALFRDFRGAAESRWHGDRPTLPDYLPMLGRAPHCKNAILAFGHQHLGLTLAATTGAIVRDLILDRPVALDLRAASADRFGRA
jgi:D-amino-acid dehydrogenase